MPDVAIVLIVILVLVLVLRGPSTLPRLGEALGQAIRGARRAAQDVDDERRDPPTNDAGAR